METVYIYPGVHPLYTVGAFVCAIIMFILISRVIYNKRFGSSGVHLYLFIWVLYFCIMDGIWGLFAAHVFNSDVALFVFSAIFHLNSALTSYVWVCFHVYTLKDKVTRPALIKSIAAIIVLIQIVMLIVNFFTEFMFYVDETGEYVSTPHRKILFYLQFGVYLAIGIVSMVKFVRIRNTEEKQDLIATFCMNISPICFGVFQMLYPDAPANSIGFAIACVIFYTFIEADYERQITEYRAKAEYQGIIEKQNADLKEQKELLQKALKAEEEANKAKTAFLFSMSHDIRTPMNAIIGFTTLAKRRSGDIQKTEEYLNKIEISSQQLLSLINQVLEMSRIESGKVSLQKQETDMLELADSVRTVYEDLAKTRGIALSVKTENIRHKNVVTDVDRVKQIITNIIGNALKYTHKGGQIDFTICETEGGTEGQVTFCFTVEDTGIGMSEEYIKHIFDEFSREETTTVNKVQGSGLGMSIVKSLTDLMHGDIEVKSKKGVGTKITVWIPMSINVKKEIIKEQEAEKLSLNGMRILLVEDNEMNREIALEILEDQGAVVEAAVNGAEAVDKIKEIYDEMTEPYDCILMDIQMPVMDGYEATARIREIEPNGKHIPIIALSANAFEEDRRKSIEIGMDDHISKPIDIGELMGRLMLHAAQ